MSTQRRNDIKKIYDKIASSLSTTAGFDKSVCEYLKKLSYVLYDIGVISKENLFSYENSGVNDARFTPNVVAERKSFLEIKTSKSFAGNSENKNIPLFFFTNVLHIFTTRNYYDFFDFLKRESKTHMFSTGVAKKLSDVDSELNKTYIELIPTFIGDIHQEIYEVIKNNFLDNGIPGVTQIGGILFYNNKSLMPLFLEKYEAEHLKALKCQTDRIEQEHKKKLSEKPKIEFIDDVPEAIKQSIIDSVTIEAFQPEIDSIYLFQNR